MSAKKPDAFCANNDSRKTYANGVCRMCYDRVRRAKARPNPADVAENSPWKPPEDDTAPMPDSPPTLGELDDMASVFAKRGPNTMPGVDEAPDDTGGIQAARQHLRSKTAIYRRRLIRQMLSQHFLEEDIINEFITSESLINTFTRQMKDVIRTIREDLAAIESGDDRWSGRVTLNAKEQYIDSLERSLRLANRFADDMTLSIKDRVYWAKLIPDLSDKIAIMKRVVHVVPGRGIVPTGDARAPTHGNEPETDEAWDEEDEEEYELPNVRGNAVAPPGLFDEPESSTV